MMTKKHFEEIALIFNRTGTWEAVQDDMCTWLAGQNPAFDKDRFNAACDR